MVTINENQCMICKESFTDVRLAGWLRIDLEKVLGPYDVLAPGEPRLIDVPVCAVCWRVTSGDVGAVSYIGMHPDDLPHLPRAEPRESLVGPLEWLAGIPVFTDPDLPRGRVELRYRGVTAAEVCAAYKRVEDLYDLHPKE